MILRARKAATLLFGWVFAKKVHNSKDGPEDIYELGPSWPGASAIIFPNYFFRPKLHKTENLTPT
jgi:hypothetical protein